MPLTGSIGPQDDAASSVPEILSFITGPGSVAGRSAGYANTLGSVLLPDMLVVQTDKDPGTAGWLNWVALAPARQRLGRPASSRTTSWTSHYWPSSGIRSAPIPTGPPARRH